MMLPYSTIVQKKLENYSMEQLAKCHHGTKYLEVSMYYYKGDGSLTMEDVSLKCIGTIHSVMMIF